jgi:lipopolysaccharide assembly protein A
MIMSLSVFLNPDRLRCCTGNAWEQPAYSGAEEAHMRWVHLTIVVLFVAAMIVLVIQNREVVTMAFLGFSIRAPLALVAAGIYVLGAITGGSLFALLRRSIEGARPARA